MKPKFLKFLPGRLLKSGATRRHKQLRSGVLPATSARGRSQWMLSRPLVRFGYFDLRAVPEGERRRALDLQVRQWAPFERPGRYVVWSGEAAAVWSWDADRVEQAMRESGVRPDSATVIPEPLLRPRRATGGCLVQCLEGFEGQVWQEGIPIASRWWGKTPSTQEWSAFLRDAAVMTEVAGQAPTPTAAEEMDEPWAPSHLPSEAGSGSARREAALVSLAGVALLAATSWYGAQLVKLHFAQQDVQQEISALEQQAEPVLVARGDALEAAERARAIQGTLHRFPDQVLLMAKFSEVLPKDGSHLRAWEFAEGKLNVQVAGLKNASPSDWVRRMEATGVFRNVQATPAADGSSIVLSMEALAPAEVKLASAQRPVAR